MRETGYYWVKYDGQWQIAYYSHGYWFSTFDCDAPLDGRFITEIGPRLTPPE